MRRHVETQLAIYVSSAKPIPLYSMKTISLMAARSPFWNCTSVTNNICICLSLIATWLCMEGMRPCGLLANYFTSCPTQPVVNICWKWNLLIVWSIPQKSAFLNAIGSYHSIALFVVFPACHDDGIENHWYQESWVCDNKVGHGGKIWTKTAANAVTCAVWL